MSNSDNSSPLYVTKPMSVPLEELLPELEKVWHSGCLTNRGTMSRALESELASYLDVEHISLFSSGTTALILALRSLGFENGEVITTPLSYIATAHAIHWSGLRPVFADINPANLNINPERIEELITPDTRAILAVHLYGNPCDHEGLEAISRKHGIKLIYDAAHAFGVKTGGVSLCTLGDLSVLSFHATKVFHTIEGGAVVCHDESTKQKLDALGNSGFDEQRQLTDYGLNGHLNEIQAAIGRIALRYTDAAIEHRKKAALWYMEQLESIPGLRCITPGKDVESNYVYFPVMIDPLHFGCNADQAMHFLESHQIYPRRYFSPLITDYELYRSAVHGPLPVAREAAKQLLCLPLSHEITQEQVIRVTGLIQQLFNEKKIVAAIL